MCRFHTSSNDDVAQHPGCPTGQFLGCTNCPRLAAGCRTVRFAEVDDQWSNLHPIGEAQALRSSGRRAAKPLADEHQRANDLLELWRSEWRLLLPALSRQQIRDNRRQPFEREWMRRAPGLQLVQPHACGTQCLLMDLLGGRRCRQRQPTHHKMSELGELPRFSDQPLRAFGKQPDLIGVQARALHVRARVHEVAELVESELRANTRVARELPERDADHGRQRVRGVDLGVGKRCADQRRLEPAELPSLTPYALRHGIVHRRILRKLRPQL
mmetsp:Transcript_123800/g.396277  ORF Transcript_123800/g.396277 Transcript_123800/m.396277 type:complete len:271 (-) Transcript_123800:463-1275(-)